MKSRRVKKSSSSQKVEQVKSSQRTSRVQKDPIPGAVKVKTSSKPHRKEIDKKIPDETAHSDQVQKILEARLRLMEFASVHTLDELLTAALDEIESLTESSIGFYHFLQSDQKTLELQNWSTNTLKNMCTAEGKGSHYDIDLAGVWVDCVRERKSIIHNDYASLSHRKGMPVGHAPVIREAVVPIFRDNLIVAIIGIGNKPTLYNQEDIAIVNQLGDLSWDIVERKRTEEALRESETKYRIIADNTSDWIFWIAPDERFIYVSPSCKSITGYEAQEFIANAGLFFDIIHPDDRQVFRQHLQSVKQDNPCPPTVFRIFHADGSLRWIEHLCTRVYDQGGNFLGSRGSNRDITERKKIQEQLEISENRLNEAQRIAHLGSWELDLSTNVLVWSDEIYNIFEIDRKQFGASYEAFLALVHPEDREMVNCAYTESVKNKTPYDIIHRLLFLDERIKFVREQCETFYNDAGKPLRSIGTVQDITEQKRAEEDLSLVNFALNNVREGASLIDRDGRFRFVNEESCHMLGYTRPELLSLSVTDVDPDFPVSMWNNRWDDLKIHRSRTIESRYITKTGNVFPVEINANYIEYEGKEYILALVRDITERKTAERALKNTNDQLTATVEAIPDLLFEMDSDLRICNYHVPLHDSLYVPPEMFLGKTVDEILPPEATAIIKTALHQASAEGWHRGAIYPLNMPDGVRWYELSITARREQASADTRYLVLARDITERKQTEETLYHMDFALNNVREAAFLISQDGHFHYINEEACRILGYSREELLSLTVTDVDPDYPLRRWTRHWEELRQHRSLTFESRHKTKSGHLFPVEITANYFEYSGKGYNLALAKDITERKQAENERNRLNRELRAISNCNQTLLRATDEQQLLTDICNIVCIEAGYRMAWVGYAEHDEEKTIRPVAWAGFDSGYIANAKLSWSEEKEHGRGPAGRVIRSGEIICVQDFATDPLMTPWKADALKRGYHSGVALPLKDNNGQIFGALLIYSGETSLITADEIRLLTELSEDLAFGITVLRTREQQKRTEEALFNSEKRFRAIFENAVDGILVSDIESKRFLKCNPMICRLMGYAEEELLTLTVNDIHPPDDLPFVIGQFKEQSDKKFTLAKNIPIQRKDGTVFYADINAFPIILDEKECLVGFFRDISDRRGAENKKLAHLHFIESLDRVTTTIQKATDIEQMLHDIVTMVFELYGCDRAWLLYPGDPDASSFEVPIEICRPEYPGASVKGLSVPMDQEFANDIRTALLSDGPVMFLRGTEHPINTVSAQQFGVQSQLVQVIFPKIGKPWIVGMHQCSYPRVWSTDEQELFKELAYRLADGLSNVLLMRNIKESEERYRTLIENQGEGIAIVDPNETFIFVNPAGESIFGVAHGDLVGKNLKMFLEPDQINIVEIESQKRLLKLQSTYEIEIKRTDGEKRTILLTATPQFDSNAQFIGTFGVFMDITERKRIEETLRKFQRATEQSPVSIVITDLKGDIEYVNPKFTAITGYSFDEVKGKNPRILKSGDKSNTEYKSMWDKILSGFEWQGEFHNKKKDGTLFWENASISPIKDVDGRITHFIAVKEDITEQKRSENELRQTEDRRHQLELELIQAQKLESLGTLASGIAHDFNNILGIIVGYSSLSERFLTNPAQLSKCFDAINKASQRGTTLVKQLLTFARKSESLFQPIQMNDIIDEVTKLLAETFPKTITLTKQLSTDIPLVNADGSQLHQVFMNLCINARDAMPQGGNLTLATDLVNIEDLADRFPKATDRRYVHILVSDTGMGIDDETRKRIFDPFFTTKGPGKGTGLGLSLVHSILENHHGMIDLSSTPGEGTTFHLYFPCEEISPLQDAIVQDSLADIPNGTETVLLIEDEEMLLDMIQTTLSLKGYTVLTAPDGMEGLEVYQRNRDRINVVLSDYGLPKCTGKEVAMKILAMDPDMKIIIASGFLEPDLKAKLFEAGVLRIIQKPYHLAEVAKTIREICDDIE